MILWVQLLIIVLFIVFNWDNLTGSGDDPDFQSLSKLSRIVLVVGGILFVPYLTIFKDVGQDNHQPKKLVKAKNLTNKNNLFRIVSKKYPHINYYWVRVFLKEDHISLYSKNMNKEEGTLYLRQVKQVNSTQYFYKKGVSVKAAIILVLNSGQKVTLEHTNYRAMVRMRNKIKTKWHKIKPHYDPVENPRTWSDRFSHFKERSRRNTKTAKSAPVSVTRLKKLCRGKFIELTYNGKQCGFAYYRDGRLSFQGKSVKDMVIMGGYADTTRVIADKVYINISPSGKKFLITARTRKDIVSRIKVLWAGHGSTFHPVQTSGNKYGTDLESIRWTDDEKNFVLSSGEGGEAWLHVISGRDGSNERLYPPYENYPHWLNGYEYFDFDIKSFYWVNKKNNIFNINFQGYTKYSKTIRKITFKINDNTLKVIGNNLISSKKTGSRIKDGWLTDALGISVNGSTCNKTSGFRHPDCPPLKRKIKKIPKPVNSCNGTDGCRQGQDVPYWQTVAPFAPRKRKTSQKLKKSFDCGKIKPDTLISNKVYCYKKTKSSITMFELGRIYRTGRGDVPSDVSASFNWYQKAANAGHIGAMSNLAWFYNDGRVVRKDCNKAFSLWKTASAKGYAKATNNIAISYYAGTCAKKNTLKAKTWLLKAVRQNSIKAMCTLAKIYYKDGVILKSRGWLKKAQRAGKRCRFTWAQSKIRPFVIYRNRQFIAPSYKTIHNSSFIKCQNLCAVAKACKAFSYAKRLRLCGMKRKMGQYAKDPFVDSAKKVQF